MKTAAQWLEMMGFVIEQESPEFIVFSHRQAFGHGAIENRRGRTIMAIRWLALSLGKDDPEVVKARAAFGKLMEVA